MTPHPTSRRSFLQHTALGGAGLLLGANAHADEGGEGSESAAIPAAKLSTLRVPLLGMGTGVKASRRSNALWRSGKKNFRETVRRAWEEGVRLFDCADTYGSLPHVAEALSDKPRDSYILVSKIWCHPKGGLPVEEPRDDAAAVVERFLKESGSDYIDIVQLHAQREKKWNKLYRRQMDALEACKEKGWIKAHGCSCHGLAPLDTAAGEPWVDVVHTRINPWGVKMDGPAKKVVPILKKMHAAGKGVIGMKLIGEGTFRNDSEKIDESLRFVLGLGCVDAVIVGFEKPEEIIDYKARLLRAVG